MKVAILYSHLKERGGAENVILKQAELLECKGHNVKCFFAYSDEQLAKDLSNSSKCYFNSPMPNNEIMRILLSIPLAPLTFSVFKDVDVLLCHGYGPAPWIGYALKKTRGLSYVSYIHSPPRFLYLTPEEKKLWRFGKTREIIYSISKVGQQILRKLDLLSVLNSDVVFVNSVFTRRRVEAIYGRRSIVCYPPVDTSVFKPLDHKITKKMRSNFGWPLIFSTGRIVPVKRWEWLIRIMLYVREAFPSATLAVAGKISCENSTYVRKLIKLAKSLGISNNVKFLGFKTFDELVRLYNAADVYAYPVPNEDFGLGPVEAMACGTPAVVWDDGAGPCETVINGKTGFRAKPYAIEDFAEKTLKIINPGKENMGESCVELVKKNFSCAQHIDKLESALSQVL